MYVHFVQNNCSLILYCCIFREQPCRVKMQLDYIYVDYHQFCKAPESAVLPVAKHATKVKLTYTYRFVTLVVNNKRYFAVDK